MKSGIVLAGGKSQRFGKNKALVDLHGKPLIKWVIEALDCVVDEVLLSLSYASDLLEFREIVDEKVIIVKDIKPNLGPISGLLSSLKKVKGEYSAVAPCDSPFIRPELYTILFEKAKGYDGAVPFLNDYWEPLHAVYKRDTFLISLEKVLSLGKKRPVDTYQYLDIQKIRQKEVKVADPNLFTFFNINTKNDLAKAEKIIESEIQNTNPKR